MSIWFFETGEVNNMQVNKPNKKGNKYIKYALLVIVLIILFSIKVMIREKKIIERRQNSIESIYSELHINEQYYNNNFGPFYIDFPNTPKIKNMTLDTRYGEMPVIIYKSVHKYTYSVWAVNFSKVPSKTLSFDVIATDLTYNYRNKKNYNEFSMVKVYHENYERTFSTNAYDIRFCSDVGHFKTYSKMRLIFSNNVLYNLFVTTTKKEDLDTGVAKKFFNSFKI